MSTRAAGPAGSRTTLRPKKRGPLRVSADVGTGILPTPFTGLLYIADVHPPSWMWSIVRGPRANRSVTVQSGERAIMHAPRNEGSIEILSRLHHRNLDNKQAFVHAQPSVSNEAGTRCVGTQQVTIIFVSDKKAPVKTQHA